jgi:colanic acid biosynthesis glycosyl transferase WcaI
MKNNKKSLIFACQVYYPDEQSTSQLFTGLMERLVIKGYKVSVLCGFPSDNKYNNIPRHQFHNGVSIERLGLRLPSKKSLIIRALVYVSFLLQIFPKVIFAPKDSELFAVTNPPFLAWIMSVASFFRRKTFIFMFLDLHPEGLIALGKLSKNAWYVGLWKWFNQLSYARSKKLLVLGRDMIPLLLNEYDLDASVIKYIPHWSASELKEPINFSDSKFPLIWGMSDSFVVQYSGNMGLWHDIDTFVRAADALKIYKNIQFVFVGGGIQKKKAMDLAMTLGLTNIRWHDFVLLHELSESLAACHLALISLNENLEGIAVPSKLYGILASGRPVIAQVPLASEVAMTVIENNCGVVVKPGDAKALATVIYNLSVDMNAVEIMSKASFRAYSKYYQLENAVIAFEKEIFD